MATHSENSELGVSVHTRLGFAGDLCATLRPNSVHEFTSVTGPHAPQRFELLDETTPDTTDPSALPQTLLSGRSGLSISVSGLSSPTPFVWKNAESDEFHFIQEGEIDFVTAFGTLRAEPGDFVYVARAVAYRLEPVSSNTLRIIVDLPERLRIATSQPFGILNPGHDISYPNPDKPSEAGGGELWLKSFDGITRYQTPGDPLALAKHLGGPIPVWKINLTHIAQQANTSKIGPPAQFAATDSLSSLFFSLSSRDVNRPPHHDNADYDEIVVYFRGPGAWGGVHQPGTLTWVPKGAMHWGPGEDVPEGYWAWLLECKDTLRVTESGKHSAKTMETGDYSELGSNT